MQVNFTFRHFEPSDALKSFARDRLDAMRRLLDQSGEASVVMSVEKHLHQVEILVRSGAFHLRGGEKSDDMYASISAAMDKIERQLKRYKGRLRQHKAARHHQEQAREVSQRIIEASPVDDEQPDQAQPASRVVDTRQLIARRMTVDEAVLQLDLDEDDFLVFTHAETGHVCVLYRRRNEGSFGLIDAAAA